MKFIKLEKVKDGKYLKNYEITYLNKAGKEKKYEIVSRKELREAADIGRVFPLWRFMTENCCCSGSFA